jgi:glutamyl-tRNA synthetase
MVTLDDSVDMAGFFFQDAVTLEPSDLIGKDLDASQTAVIVKQVHELLQQTDDFSADGLEQLLREFVDQSAYNNKQVFGILRVAITGQRVSPPLFETMEIVGKDKALVRLLHAIALLEKIN